MSENKDFYRVPVFDVNWDTNTIEEQQITKDEAHEAGQYIAVDHQHPENDDPVLEVVLVTPDQEETYRFRVHDQDLKECTYQGEDRDTIPTYIQHAVAVQEYGIDGRCRRDIPLFLWMKGTELLEATRAIRDFFQQFPIMDVSLRTVIEELDILGLYTLARNEVPPDTYWDSWRDVAGQPAGLDEEMLKRVAERLQSEIADTNPKPVQGEDDDDAVDIPIGLNTETVRHEDDEYLLIDMLSPWGAHRFRFSIQGDNECIYEGPDEVRLPTFVKDRVEKCGYEVGNRPSPMYSNSPPQNLRRYIEWCDRVESLPLIPDDTTGPLANPIRVAQGDVETLVDLVAFFEEEPEAAANLHNGLCEEYGVRSAEDVTNLNHRLITVAMYWLMPDRYQSQL